MTPCLHCTLPWPPSMNHYWRHVVIGHSPRTLISASGREFRENVTRSMALQKTALRIDSRVKIDIVLHAPNRRRYDIDNRIKPLLDALTHAGVWADDEQVDKITVERGDIVAGGKAEVYVTPLTAEVAHG